MIKNDVNVWAEAISSLPDKQFFSIMRLYLGEIKTPYNKQRLVQQLAIFIRQEQNYTNIITLLDEFDVKVLTAISLLSNVTQENLTEFFKNTCSLAELYTEILNLKERLLIYTNKDSYTGKETLLINPLLEEKLQPYLDVNLLFPTEEIASFSTEDIFTISPNFIAAFISYIKIHGLSCKADGGLKKNDINRLEEIFPGRLNAIQLLVTAFINLGILVDDTKKLNLDCGKLENFAKLPLIQQYAFLCAATVSHFNREALKKEAQLLMNCLHSIPSTGYTTQTILWLAFLAGNSTETNTTASTGRFSQLLQQARNSTETNTNADILDLMISSAITFGLLQKLGTNPKNQNVYVCATLDQIAVPQEQADFTDLSNQSLQAGQPEHINQSLQASQPDLSSHDNQPRTQQNLPKVLNIDSTFTVSLMPGLPLSALLPLTDFMNIKKFGVVTEFEITKQSVSTGFDKGLAPQNLFDQINQYTYYELPQNLKINVSEWYNTYCSAVIYHGYILKVSGNNIQIAENNPKIKKYLKEKLADGIYLLNIPVTENINFFKDESGLDFLGNTKTYSGTETSQPFPILQNSTQLEILSKATDKTYSQISIAKTEALLKQIKNELSTKEMDEHKKECLEHRINNRMILTPQQLDIAAIRTEILEADGMDYSGKLHLLDTAIKEEDLLELQMPDAKGNFTRILGHPLTLTKQSADAVLRFQLEPDGFVDNLLVSRITHIKRLRY